MGTYVTYPYLEYQYSYLEYQYSYLEYHRYRVQVPGRVMSRLHQRKEYHYRGTYMFPVGFLRYPS
jgi:hypothetical protein